MCLYMLPVIDPLWFKQHPNIGDKKIAASLAFQWLIRLLLQVEVRIH